MSHRRKVEDKKRLEKLYGETKNNYGSGVWYDNNKGRYIRYYLSNTSGLAKYYKRISNKKVRKYPHILKRKQYKKVFEYQWIMT